MPEHRTIALDCRNVTVAYRATTGTLTRALDDVSIAVSVGELVAVVGSSGSGKSTLLRVVAGLERPTSGTVTRCGNVRTGMVFQSESVFPWRTIEGNLTYSLEVRSVPRTERRQRAEALCSLVGLSPSRFLQKYPRELSGGEVRRVAIAMALSADASLMLLDEPTSQLDYVNRIRVQRVVAQLWHDTRPTIVLVTHDVEEAIALGQRIVILKRGVLVDVLVRPDDGISQSFADAAKSRILTLLED